MSWRKISILYSQVIINRLVLILSIIVFTGSKSFGQNTGESLRTVLISLEERLDISFTYADEKLNIIDNKIRDQEHSAHVKFKLKKRFSNRFKLYFGSEYFTTKFNEEFSSDVVDKTDYGYSK